jgi:hypothetical protein
MYKQQFQEYYIGRKGIYHNKNVIILSVSHDIIQYQDFGLKFDDLEIIIYYDDGSNKTDKLKGNFILRNLKLY